MKANEFVKKYDWDFAKHMLSNDAPILIISSGERDNLKRLVESYELVLTRGGLPMAKADMLFLDAYEKESPYWVKMADAIKDVESCL